MRKLETDEEIDRLKEFILAQSPETKIYLGTDSFRIRQRKVARYTTAVVVHIDGCRGCSLWGKIVEEPDYDKVQSRPKMRLMNEVYKTAEMYMKLADVLEDRDVEVHMDINPNKIHGSSIALQEAIGYIRGTCNITPMVKPDAFAASFGADRFREYGRNTGKRKSSKKNRANAA